MNDDNEYPISEFNSMGLETYYEDSNGFWSETEYDADGGVISYKDSDTEAARIKLEDMHRADIEKKVYLAETNEQFIGIFKKRQDADAAKESEKYPDSVRIIEFDINEKCKGINVG